MLALPNVVLFAALVNVWLPRLVYGLAASSQNTVSVFAVLALFDLNEIAQVYGLPLLTTVGQIWWCRPPAGDAAGGRVFGPQLGWLGTVPPFWKNDSQPCTAPVGVSAWSKFGLAMATWKFVPLPELFDVDVSVT